MGMSITEKLMKIDNKKFDELPTGKCRSEVLSDIFGEDVEVEIKAIDSTDLLMLSEKANDGDTSVKLDAMIKIACMGMVNPDLKSVELKEKFGLNPQATPQDVFNKIWGRRKLEATQIATAILKLNGISVNTNEIKN